MKKSFHVFFLFVLFAFFAVNAAWAADVTLQTDAQTGEKFVNMPATGTSTVNITSNDIANGITTIKVYDDGGKDGNYSWNADGYLALNVPQGYVLQVTGFFTGSNIYQELLKIFDGSSDGQVLFNEYASDYGHGDKNIGVYISTGNLLTLYFAASSIDPTYVESGLDLTIKIIKMNLDLVADGEGGYYVNMLAQNTATLNITAADIKNGITSFKVYDDGGKGENYSWNANGYLMLTAPEGYMFQVEGDVQIYDYHAEFTIYDGNSGNQELLDEYKSSNYLGIGKIISTANAITLCIKSSATITDQTYNLKSGLDLTVKVIKTNLDLVADGEDGYYVNMLSKKSATLKITTDDVAKGITSFNVYDDGGKDGDFSYDANDYLTIIAPKGYVLRVTGDVYSTYQYSTGWLTVYDGNSDATQLLNGSSGYSSLNVNVSSTDSVVTLYFKSTATSQNNTCVGGLELLVTLLQPHIITINDVDGGSVTTDKTTATLGDEVTLTISPNLTNDYELTNLVVTYGENNSTVNVVVSDDKSSATFTMPASDVTVTASFAKVVHSVTVTNVDGGSVTTDKTTATLGDKVTLTISPDLTNDYELTDLAVTYGENGSVTLTRTGNTATFTMPASDVTLTPSWSKVVHSVTIAKVTGGTVTTDKTTATLGEKVTLTISPDLTNDYKLTDLAVTYGENGSVTVTRTGNTATFTMPASDVTVIPTWKQVEHNVTITNVTGGTIETDAVTTTYGKLVTLTISAAEHYVLRNIAVTTKDGAVDVLISDDKTKATFTMPAANVSVKPSWDANLIENGDGGLFVNMPRYGTNELGIPEDVASFKVYDDGGKDGNYSYDADGYLVLVAPEGFKFEVTGTVYSYCNAGLLSIYDGENSQANALLLDKYGYNGADDIGGTIASSGNKLMLKFYSKYATHNYSEEVANSVNPGLDLTVTLINDRPVQIISVAGGSLIADNNFAQENDLVTLTASPNDGYVLNGISVVDADNNPVTVEGGEWYSGNMATFTMPSTNVTVTPVWTNKLTAEGGLFINTLVTGTMTATVPAGVTSFKVYDDGGKNGYYTKGTGSYLELTAPEGKTFRITGSISMARTDVIDIFEGVYDANYLIVDLKGNSDVETQVSVGNKIFIYIGNTTTTGNNSGFDLNVEIVDASVVAFAVKKNKKTAVINGSFKGEDVINITEETEVDAVEFKREFSTNGNGYSTIVLPFDYYVEKDYHLVGADAVIEFTGMTKNGDVGMSYVWCSEAVEKALEAAAPAEDPENYEHCNSDKTTYSRKMKAYVPYMIQMKTSSLKFGRSSFTLEPTPAISEARVGEWVFRGTTAKKIWKKEETKDGNVWAFAGSTQEGVAEYVGQFVMLGAGAYTPALRAYMVKEPPPQQVAPRNGSFAAQFANANKSAGVEAASMPESMNVVIVSRGSNGEEHRTVIGTLNTRTGEFEMLRDYDLKGRKVNGVNKARGAYYGKKVLKK